jgi:nucleoside triphosphate pyrophosphatase
MRRIREILLDSANGTVTLQMKRIPAIKVILASASPRRQEMLRDLQIDFKVTIPNIKEKWSLHQSAHKVATELAIRKTKQIRDRGALVIGMDTLVVISRLKLGKPGNVEEARAMLQLLSGRTHQVITGVAMKWRGNTVSGVSVTKVRFRRIKEKEIEWYLESDEPYDKAGGYAIQGLARIFINRIDGCYYNVVGFPLTLFQILLRRLNLSILQLQRG